MVAGDFNGAAWRRQSGRDSLDQSVLLRKPSPTRVYLSRLAAHFYEDQGACQVNGRKCEVSRNRWVPRMNGKSASMAHSLSLMACWASRKQIKVAITKLGSTSSTLMLGWLIVYPRKTNTVDQPRERGTHSAITARKGGARKVHVIRMTTHGFHKLPFL